MTRFPSHLIGTEILLEVGSDDRHPNHPLSGVDLTPTISNQTRHKPKSESTPPSTVVGVLMGFSEAGRPLVNFSGNASPVPIESRSTVPLGLHQVGKPVVLIFEEADQTRPIILGVVCDPEPALPKALPIVAKVDNEKLIFTAEKEIVLRCGQASITLTRAGKVIVRGAYLLSRSSGVNRIDQGWIGSNQLTGMCQGSNHGTLERNKDEGCLYHGDEARWP